MTSTRDPKGHPDAAIAAGASPAAQRLHALASTDDLGELAAAASETLAELNAGIDQALADLAAGARAAVERLNAEMRAVRERLDGGPQRRTWQERLGGRR